MNDTTLAELSRFGAVTIHLTDGYRLHIDPTLTAPHAIIYLYDSGETPIAIFTDHWFVNSYAGPFDRAHLTRLRAAGYGWIAEALEATP